MWGDFHHSAPQRSDPVNYESGPPSAGADTAAPVHDSCTGSDSQVAASSACQNAEATATGVRPGDARSKHSITVGHAAQPAEDDDDFGDFCAADSPSQAAQVNRCVEQQGAAQASSMLNVLAATALPADLFCCRPFRSPSVHSANHLSNPASTTVHQPSCVAHGGAAQPCSTAEHSMQPPPAPAGMNSAVVPHADDVEQPRDGSWGDFTFAAPAEALKPHVPCDTGSSPAHSCQSVQTHRTCESTAANSGRCTSAQATELREQQTVAGCGLPFPADLFSQQDSIGRQSAATSPHVSSTPHTQRCLNMDSVSTVPVSTALSTDHRSTASCTTTNPDDRTGSCCGAPDNSACQATACNSVKSQRSAPLPADMFFAAAADVPSSITTSCASEFVSQGCSFESAGPRAVFSVRPRSRAGAVCEGLQGGTAFEQPHLYSHASEEELVWGDGPYSEALLHQDVGSGASRRTRSDFSVPRFQVVAQKAAVRSVTDRCGEGARGVAQKASRQASMLWPERRACAEATEYSGDGSNGSVDELGFTTPASPEDLAYDEAHAINSLFQRRSSNGENRLLAYSRGTAATQTDVTDAATGVTPRAMNSEAALQGGEKELLQHASCSPISPSCVAQLSVHESHVYLRVHEGADDTAMLATDTQGCARGEHSAGGTQSIAVESSEVAGQGAFELGEAEARHSMAELAPSVEAACAAGSMADLVAPPAEACCPSGSMECDAPEQDATVSGEESAQTDASADCEEKSSSDTVRTGLQCVKSAFAEEDAEESHHAPKRVCAAHRSAEQAADTSNGGQPTSSSCRNGETGSPTYVFARALSLSLKRLSQSLTGTVDARGQPVDQQAVQAHVCERLACKGQHVLALAEAFAQVGLAERLPAATIVSTAPPSFWPSIAVVHKLSQHILEHSTAQAAGDSENDVSACSARTAPVVPHLRATVPVEPMTARGGARAQSARPSQAAAKYKKEPIVVDFPRQLPSKQHTFRFRNGFSVLDSAAEEETEEVVMYTSSIASLRKTAADTRRMRQILDAFQVQYQEVDLALQPRMRRRMLEISDDFDALPQLHCRGKIVGDGDTCFDLHDFGELMPILLNGESPRVPDEEESVTESPVSSEDVGDSARGRHIFNCVAASSDSPCSNGPREFEKIELPGELLQKLQVAVDSEALQACLAELPPVTENPGVRDSRDHSMGDLLQCALTGLPSGDWKVDRVDVSFASTHASASARGSRSLEGESGRGDVVVIAAAANLWLSLVDEALPSLGSFV